MYSQKAETNQYSRKEMGETPSGMFYISKYKKKKI